MREPPNQHDYKSASSLGSALILLTYRMIARAEASPTYFCPES